MLELINNIIYLQRKPKYKFLKSATPFPECYLHKEKWTFDS